MRVIQGGIQVFIRVLKVQGLPRVSNVPAKQCLLQPIITAIKAIILHMFGIQVDPKPPIPQLLNLKAANARQW